jgi:hypothetical protein
MLVDNVLTEVLCVNALQGAHRVLKKGSDQPRTGSVGLENTTPASLLGGGGSSSGVTAAAQSSRLSGAGAVSAEAESPAISTTLAAAKGGGVEMGPSRQPTRPAEDGGPDPGQRQSKRQRRQHQPYNAAKLGGNKDTSPTERICYLVAEALDTEVDDTDPCWDEAKRKEMHSQVIENDTYEVVSAALLGGRKALSSMWVRLTKADGRMKARFVSKDCRQKADVDYNETWAPVAKLVTLRIFLSLVAILQLSTL